MPRTSKKPKYLNLTTAQARHLVQQGELLLVLAVEPQPTVKRPKPVRYLDHWRWNGGNAWTTFGPPPLGQPGDVVLCRERWASSPCYDDWDAQRIPEGRPIFLDRSGVPKRTLVDGYHKIRSPRAMPDWAIRLRPMIASVECREVRGISEVEACKAGFTTKFEFVSEAPGEKYWECVAKCDEQFEEDWHHRYHRRGEAYSFDRAWGWFYLLTTKGT